MKKEKPTFDFKSFEELPVGGIPVGDTPTGSRIKILQLS